jgi:hypothetical protein
MVDRSGHPRIPTPHYSPPIVFPVCRCWPKILQLPAPAVQWLLPRHCPATIWRMAGGPVWPQAPGHGRAIPGTRDRVAVNSYIIALYCAEAWVRHCQAASAAHKLPRLWHVRIRWVVGPAVPCISVMLRWDAVRCRAAEQQDPPGSRGVNWAAEAASQQPCHSSGCAVQWAGTAL